MQLNNQLTNRLKEVLTEGTWVTGTNFKSQIVDLDWQIATQKVHDLNTIAALTFHIHYYIAGVLQVLKGGTLDIRDKYSFDMPPITCDADWQNLITTFWNDSEAFINHVEQMTNEQLLAPFVKEEYGNYLRNINVMIEHTYYHLGQVLLIKKLLKNIS